MFQFRKQWRHWHPVWRVPFPAHASREANLDFCAALLPLNWRVPNNYRLDKHRSFPVHLPAVSAGALPTLLQFPVHTGTEQSASKPPRDGLHFQEEGNRHFILHDRPADQHFKVLSGSCECRTKTWVWHRHRPAQLPGQSLQGEWKAVHCCGVKYAHLCLHIVKFEAVAHWHVCRGGIPVQEYAQWQFDKE